jgi:GT2 family glycosyltransferase
MMTKIPVAGVVWQTLHYLLGFGRLGFDTYYVEAHARAPSMLMRRREDDSGALAAAFIERALQPFGLGDRWGYEALHRDGRCYGLSHGELRSVLNSAELIINLHGGTAPRTEHSGTGRLVYLETDPVQLQIELEQERVSTIEFLEHHCAFFTFAENWGRADCSLPSTRRFDFRPTRQPVCLDLWPPADGTTNPHFTTVGNWRQRWRDLMINGRLRTWSKDVQFEQYLSLPSLTGEDFELALGSCGDDDRQRLRAHGWIVTDASELSSDLDTYRDYIRGSYAEFTVAKEQNVAMRSGWFSDRSATYLAGGRPVITQDTGFSNVLPTGTGLHAFSSIDEAMSAVESVAANYEYERKVAREIATECFCSDLVLRELLDAVGVGTRGSQGRRKTLGHGLRLTPLARRPLRLDPSTVECVSKAPIPFGPISTARAVASIVVVSHNNLHLTRMCVESILENTDDPPFELIIVDNGSHDGSRTYLRTLACRIPAVRLKLNERNRGFPVACNQGLRLARGHLLLILNNDTIVPPGWLARLASHATAPEVGIVGPVTNRIGNEAEVDVGYDTYGGFVACAGDRADRHAGEHFELPMPAMFCVAFRRDVYTRVGPLDEAFGLGTCEDDDYAERVRRSGYRTTCAEDVLVHHFGQGSLGEMFASGAYSRLIEANRRRFEQKWGTPWTSYGRRQPSEYDRLRARVQQIVSERIPPGSRVIVASRGDEDLLRFEGQEGWHFPQMPDGVYAGHYPADSVEAIEHLEHLRARGGGYFLVPKTSLWWLDHYGELGLHLAERYREIFRDDACVVFALDGAR